MTDYEKSGSYAIEVARVDYLTLTSFEPTGWSFWKSILERESGLIQDEDDTQIMQYSGYYWRNGAGTAYLGSGQQTRGEHIMLRVSGDLAHELFYRVTKAPIKEGWARVRRIDLQITVPQPDTWSQKRYYTRLLKAGLEPDTRSSASGLNRRVLRTIYLGSRFSNRFIRTYEKQADDGQMYLRFETEYHREKAQKIAAKLIDFPQFSQEYLLYELQKIGDEHHESLFAKHLDGSPRNETVRRVGNQDRTRKWLLETVLPAFDRHIRDHDNDGLVALAFGRSIGQALGNRRPEQWD